MTIAMTDKEFIQRLQKAFIAGWNVGVDIDFCMSPTSPTSEQLRQMAKEDWEEYLERTDEEGN